MPRINQQSPKARNNGIATTGSILDEIIPVGDIADDFIKITIYGQNRVGKTYLACQFPKPLLLIALEPSPTGGAKTVKKVAGVDYLRVTSTRQAMELVQALKPGSRYATYVVDSATSLQDIVLKEILNLPEVPEQLNWGMVDRNGYRQRSEKTREMLRPFLDLRANTVIIAKERDHNPPDKEKPEILRGFQLESFLAADLGGATVGWLHDACDYICRLYLDKEVITSEHEIKLPGGKTKTVQRAEETGRIVRRLRTMYHPNFAAGLRSCDPEKVPEYIEAPSFDKIYAIIKGD